MTSVDQPCLQQHSQVLSQTASFLNIFIKTFRLWNSVTIVTVIIAARGTILRSLIEDNKKRQLKLTIAFTKRFVRILPCICLQCLSDHFMCWWLAACQLAREYKRCRNTPKAVIWRRACQVEASLKASPSIYLLCLVVSGVSEWERTLSGSVLHVCNVCQCANPWWQAHRNDRI